MVDIEYTDEFRKTFKKIKTNALKEKVKAQIKKIMENPLIGKPMRYERKGTREVYISPFRLAYSYHEDTIVLHAIYHKDQQ